MKPITYRTLLQDGERITNVGYATGVPGLLVSVPSEVACPCGDFTAYAVIHARSGAMAGHGFDSPEAALAAARDLGPLADWRLTGEEIGALGVAHAAREINLRWGGHSGTDRPRHPFIDNGVVA